MCYVCFCPLFCLALEMPDRELILWWWCSPKLAVHVFIGSRLALLAESGDKMSAGDKAINYLSMIFGGVLGFAVGLLIYRRTMARAAELATSEGLENGDIDGLGAVGDLDGDERAAAEEDSYGMYADGERSRLMRGGGPAGGVDTDAAALMDDDDISLWGSDGIDPAAAAAGGYRDSWDEEATTGQRNGAKR